MDEVDAVVDEVVAAVEAAEETVATIEELRNENLTRLLRMTHI